MRPLSVFKRRAYAALRDDEATRAHAAEVAAISVSSARQIDAAERRCGQCGRPRKDA
jgi:hypothetical protein